MNTRLPSRPSSSIIQRTHGSNVVHTCIQRTVPPPPSPPPPRTSYQPIDTPTDSPTHLTMVSAARRAGNVRPVQRSVPLCDERRGRQGSENGPARAQRYRHRVRCQVHEWGERSFITASDIQRLLLVLHGLLNLPRRSTLLTTRPLAASPVSTARPPARRCYLFALADLIACIALIIVICGNCARYCPRVRLREHRTLSLG